MTDAQPSLPPKLPVNPFRKALVFIWVIAVFAGVVVLLFSAAADFPVGGVITGTALVAVGICAALTHLGAELVLWQLAAKADSQESR